MAPGLSIFKILMQNGLSSMLAALVLAFVIRYIFENFLKNVFKRTKTKLDDELIDVSKSPVFWTVLLGGIYLFLASLHISQGLHNLLSSSTATLVILIWSSAIVKIAKILVREYDKRLESGGRLSDAIPFVENLIVIVIAAITGMVALDVWGVNITPFLASAGVAGIAVAFAAKDTVSNLFGGVSVFFDKPYKVGDYVIIREQYRGEVTEIGMRSTRIRTRDNVLISVPNSVMVTDAVINETGFDPRLRIRIPLGVEYGSDLERVEYILLNILKEHKSVLKEPAPRIRYRNFGESAIELEILATIDRPANKGKVIHELIKEVDRVFKEETITIPYPQRVVHMHKH
jgi:MscS family membrane protein